MSLVCLLLRLSTVKALSGATWAGEAVRDSEIAPIDAAAAEEKQPFISVYVDEGRSQPVGRDLFEGVAEMTLVLEFGITAQMSVRDEDGREITEQGMPVTDAGLELTLDVLHRQAFAALMDPENEWADLWRSIVSKVVAVDILRGAKADGGPRFAGRQVKVHCKTLRDPAVGAALTGIWPKALALIAGDAELAFLEPVIRGLVAGDLPEWQIDQARRGLSADEARALNLTPPPEAEATSPNFDGVTVSGPEPSA
ncbi:hypothetical protein [Breoghania sp. JC706]|uniref:hypothetical protein n=1 Tax=Breoghania sp. JC706 TaxID=3117732 RepID=UPI00300B1012